MLSIHCTKGGQDIKNWTSDNTSFPFGDLDGRDNLSVHVFVCSVMETEGERQLHHLLTVSLCPYVQQHYLSSLHWEWDAWNSCWNCVCVCVCPHTYVNSEELFIKVRAPARWVSAMVWWLDSISTWQRSSPHGGERDTLFVLSLCRLGMWWIVVFVSAE